MRIILQPCGNAGSRKHYQDTIENYFDFEKHSKTLGGVLTELKKLFPNGKAAVWGVTEGKTGQNKAKWEKVQPGDAAVFSREGGIFAIATVAAKFHLPELAKDLWGVDESGATWEYVYFLDEVRQVNIPYLEFNQTVGYKDNFVIQGFLVLDEDKSELFLSKYDFESRAFYPETTKTDYENAITSLAKLDSLDREVNSYSRVEQGYLRGILFPNQIARCAICGQEYPVSFLVAAHIKKRSACTNAERLDAKNLVMAACTFGCDELFERGYVGVDGEGKILTSKKARITDAITTYLNHLHGRVCGAFSSESKKYFKWHMDLIFQK